VTRASWRRGLPYRWWATETGTMILTAALLALIVVALLGAWVRAWGAPW
jgi:hypothetical protein